MPEKRSYAPGQFCWSEVGVRDAGQAKQFYAKLLGWKAVDVPIDGGGNYTLMRLGDTDVAGLYELSKEQLAQGVPPAWLAYVAVESADRSTELAKTLGAQVMTGPFDVMTLGRMSVIADPQGAAFAIWQAKEHKGSGLLGENGTAGWCELATKDVHKAKEFYSQLFGWRLDTKSDKGREYTEIAAGGMQVGGMMALTPDHGPTPPHWLTYFMVGDCDEHVGVAQKNGGKVLVPPMNIPKVGRFAVLADPSGAAFAVIKLDFTGHMKA